MRKIQTLSQIRGRSKLPQYIKTWVKNSFAGVAGSEVQDEHLYIEGEYHVTLERGYNDSLRFVFWLVKKENGARQISIVGEFENVEHLEYLLENNKED